MWERDCCWLVLTANSGISVGLSCERRFVYLQTEFYFIFQRICGKLCVRGSTKNVLPNSSHVCCRCCCCFVTQKRGRWRERELWFPRTHQLLQLRGELKAKVKKCSMCTLALCSPQIQYFFGAQFVISLAAVKNVSHSISSRTYSISHSH